VEVKSQGVRMFDVAMLGPFMVWYAARSCAPKWARPLLAVAGLGTMLYNWRNYQKIKAGKA